jgi:hypothetical protein
VTRQLLAVQAQELRGAKLAIRARSSGVTAVDVDAALDAGELIVSTLNRGTLHLVEPEAYRWLHTLTTPQLRTTSLRRLQQEGVSPGQAERGVEVIAKLIAEEGPRTRAELRTALDSAGVPTKDQAFIHLIFAATLDGRIVRGPMRGAQHQFVLVADWLRRTPAAPVDEKDALAELARRYLAGHGPATDVDLARWAGITLGRARRGLGAIAGELDADPSEKGLVALASAPEPEGMPPARMLGQFEPVLLGWESRREIVGARAEKDGLVTSGGTFRPFALVNGKAVATWRLEKGVPELASFARISKTDRAALAADAAEVERFLAG